MKTVQRFPIALVCILMYSFATMAQKVIISGEAVVGLPGEGDSLLTLNSERSWIFRQYDKGPSAALELFSTVGLKNFIINSTGNVGIEVLLPSEKLHVNGNIKAVGPKISFGSSEYFSDAGGFLIECNGTLESAVDGADDLGTSSRRWRNIWATNGIINTSDIRFKSNVLNMSYGLKEIMMLRPVSFQWKNNPEYGTKLGLVAQEVQKVISEVVVDHEFTRDENTGDVRQVPSVNLGMYYSDLIPVLIKATQEQQQLIDEKDARLTALESKMDILETRLARVEQLMLSPIPQKTGTQNYHLVESVDLSVGTDEPAMQQSIPQ